MIELYAIVDGPPGRLPEASLRAVRCNGLAAICGPADEEQDLSSEALWRHEELVEALMEERDVLPVRFGTRLADESEAVEELRVRRRELHAALDRVRGAVELAIRAHGAEDDAAPSRAESLHRSLSDLAREAAVRSPAEGPELLRAAYLVDREAVDRFVALVRRLDAGDPELELLCTGPWPPYTFVGA